MKLSERLIQKCFNGIPIILEGLGFLRNSIMQILGVNEMRFNNYNIIMSYKWIIKKKVLIHSVNYGPSISRVGYEMTKVNGYDWLPA